MTKLIGAIYELVGEDDVKGPDAPKELVKRVFKNLDDDQNGSLNAEEFIEGISSDPQLMRMLAPQAQ